jgi:D-alanyl-D-alanine carboxypeptidase/D-alanyl-D-alanine-endopeptidase (penicillin-binding protein 4)
VHLVWHVETFDHQVLESSGSDEPINPASVTKTATTLRALSTLGPNYRFETQFHAGGPVDRKSGLLDGDLVVEGGGDPDFHVENAFLVAAQLNREGVRRVGGALVVDDKFWIGWEGGSDRRIKDPARRPLEMAARLRRALDPALWDRESHRAWTLSAKHLGLDPDRPPKVVVARTAHGSLPPAGTVLVTHRSNPLSVLLRRFNAYSNNDIERLDTTIGPATGLGSWLSTRLGVPPETLHFDTSSGLGSNRMTPRLVVSLLRELSGQLARSGRVPDDVLSVAGCDRGTVARLYRTVSRTPGVLVGKTGTLTRTDGGVSVLGGILRTARGDLLFCVAAPESAGEIYEARRATERWVLDRLARYGVGQPGRCGPPIAGPADEIEISPSS